MVEENINNSPFITIGDVQVTADELPDADSKRWFAQLQVLNQQKAKQAFDLERTQVAINGFNTLIVERYNEGTEVDPEEEVTE